MRCRNALIMCAMQAGAAQATRALILVPTRELAEQVSTYLKGLLVYCEDEVATSNLASGTTTHLQRCVICPPLLSSLNLSAL